jgi:hypothetical protein
MTLTATTRKPIWLAAFVCATISSALAQAELPIDIEVVTEAGVPLTAPQEWARLLGKMGLDRVRVRSGRAGERAQVTKVDGAVGARFKVVAILNRRGELVLPKRRYRVSDRQALGEFFRALPQQESFGEDRGRFELTEEQFRRVHADLSRVIRFSTAGKTPADLLDQLEHKFNVSVVRDATAREALRQAKPLEAELRNMSAGTALAIALRQEGLVLRPEKPVGEPLRMVIERQRPKRDAWPVGWKSEGSPRLLAPKMFEFLTIEIDGFTLSKAVEALQPRLAVTVVYDERILAERKIQPDEIQVKLPAGKTYLKRAVDRLLSQARLAGELRVDEQGRPFYWITQFGKDSPRVK